jgi:large subunit ribosomal protein L2
MQLNFNTLNKVRASGRSASGRITVYHRGGGHRRKYRIVDLTYKLFDVPGIVVAIEKDPNRNCFIALVAYANGLLVWTLAVKGLEKNFKVVSTEYFGNRLGGAVKLLHLPLGAYVCAVEMYPASGAVIARSAGASVQILRRFGAFTQIRLRSGEVRLVLSECKALMGALSNDEIKLFKLYKAGSNRLRGRRPVVRGVAKNPIDHPHGGGQGKTKGGRPSVTPWGKLTKGRGTRTTKKVNRYILKSRKYEKNT